MGTALTEDVQVLRSGLAWPETSRDRGDPAPPRESAKKVLALLDAEQTTGAVVVPAKQEFTTTGAAKMLGMSPTLMRMIGRRGVDFKMVGTHHRIPATSIQRMREFLDEDHIAVVAGLANKYGNVD